MKASYALVSRITGDSEKDIESMYKSACDEGSPCLYEVSELDDDELSEDDLTEDRAEEGNECIKLLEAIKNDTDSIKKAAADEAAEEDAEGANATDKKPEVEVDLEWKKLSDSENMQMIMGDDVEEASDPGWLPKTLLEVIQTKGELFNLLWRLTLRLRSIPGGCDTQFFPNAKSCRKASKGLNWFQ